MRLPHPKIFSAFGWITDWGLGLLVLDLVSPTPVIAATDVALSPVLAQRNPIVGIGAVLVFVGLALYAVCKPSGRN
jgi:hypothetical protein